MEEEARRQAEASVAAKRKRELKIFKEAVGPTLDDDRAGQLWEIYQDYYSERVREFKKRTTAALLKSQETGKVIDMPDKEEVFAEVRAEAYKKLEIVLTAGELGAFRTWWESCHPKRKKDSDPK
jgi:hypothetical protein